MKELDLRMTVQLFLMKTPNNPNQNANTKQQQILK